MPCYQDQRPWSSQLVAGRPCSTAEKVVLSSPCDNQEVTCKRSSHMWMEHDSSAFARPPYSSSADRFLSYGSETFISEDFSGDAYSMTSTRELVNYLVDFSSFSPKVAEVVHDFDDSDASDSDTDIDYDSDAEAQYITIPPESPWWKAPSENSSSSGSISFDTLVGDDEGYDAPSNHSLEEVLQKQQYLVGLFHDELRRIVPEGSYDDSWLAEVDAKLLVAPVEAFKDACRGSMTASTGPTPMEFERKPLPDVPVDFEEDGDIEDEGTDSPGEWEYPSYGHRISILKAHPNLDPRFVAHMAG